MRELNKAIEILHQYIEDYQEAKDMTNEFHRMEVDEVKDSIALLEKMQMKEIDLDKVDHDYQIEVNK